MCGRFTLTWDSWRRVAGRLGPSADEAPVPGTLPRSRAHPTLRNETGSEDADRREREERRPLALALVRIARIFSQPKLNKDMTEAQHAASKVPAVTLLFWIIKIAATTLGETGGDAVSMSMNLGYLVSTGIFAVIFLIAVSIQMKAREFHPVLYWTTIIATTTVGTTLADFADRSLGIGYAGGSALLLTLLLASLTLWHYTMGSISVASVSSPKTEMFYWVTIMFSQTLGTALGDWTADSAGLGYECSALLFGALLTLVAAAYYWLTISTTALFWVAFVLTRPLGAVVGDFLDKPLSKGGLALSRYSASAALLAFIVACIAIIPQRSSQTAH
jgi:uncharacterized membrane-anchored protein